MDNNFDLRNQLDREFEEESDRGCAVLTVCLLEEALARLFSKVLAGGERAAKHFMPKGRLSVGVANAHALGLLNDLAVDNFKLILEIRNIFAHKLLTNVSFRSEAIKSKIKALQLPNMDEVPEHKKQIIRSPRKHFMMVIDSLFFTLEWLSDHAKPLAVTNMPQWKLRKAPSHLLRAHQRRTTDPEA